MAVYFKKGPALFFATGFYSGLIPIAPGTMGTLVAAVPFFFIPITIPNLLYAILFFSIISGFSIRSAAKALGARSHYRDKTKARVIDQQEIVIDEFVGVWIGMLTIPFFPNINPFISVSLAIIIFRVFDIFKLFGISKLDDHPRLKNAFGVMIDDVVAGIYTAIILIPVLSIA